MPKPTIPMRNGARRAFFAAEPSLPVSMLCKRISSSKVQKECGGCRLPVTTMVPVMALMVAAAAEGPARPNVLMVVSDDLRPAIGAYHGEDTVHTPNLDALAVDPRATVFKNAYVQQVWGSTAVCSNRRCRRRCHCRPQRHSL